MERRSFLNTLLSVSGLALLGSMLYPVVHYLIPPESSGHSVDSVTAAKVGQLKPDSALIFKFGDKPGILIMTPEGQYRAFTAVCTHLGCTVRYRADIKEIWCPCHNGYYNLHGKNVAGPPPKPLTEFAVHVQGKDILVSRRQA